MGGKLFTEDRLDKEQFLKVKDQILTELQYHFPDRTFLVPRDFGQKESWGDLDVVCDMPLISDRELMNCFNITEKDIHHNSSVISFNYYGFQCDLCHHIPEDLTTAIDYMNHGDCSMLVGRIIETSTGYRLSHKGLTYPIKLRHDDKLGNVLVSKDRRVIHQFIGLDHDKWLSGFDDALDLFKWVTASPYFNRDVFALAALNHENKTRNVKRPTYMKFVEWLTDDTLELNHYVVPPDKQEHLFRGLLHFRNESGWWIDQAQQMIQDRQWQEQARATFNATDIMKITGLAGPSLGKVRKAFDQYLIELFSLDYGNEPVYLHRFIGYDKDVEAGKKVFTTYFNDFYKQYQLDNACFGDTI
jgi:hypothetical protein